MFNNVPFSFKEPPISQSPVVSVVIFVPVPGIQIGCPLETLQIAIKDNKTAIFFHKIIIFLKSKFQEN